MTYPETHRQFYLSAAGIRMWYAKRLLPGAAPSPSFVFEEPEPAQKPALKSEPKASRVRSVPEIESVPDVEPLPEPSSAPAPAPAPASESAPYSAPGPAPMESAVSSGPVAAHLAIWAAGQYLLISQWSTETSERLQDSLARNLLFALDEKTAGERQMLHWPVFRNINIPGNSDDDFRDLLLRVVHPHEACSVILLGVMANEDTERRQKCLPPPLARAGVDFSHSLAELAASPLLKRDLWNELKSLKRV